MDTTGSHTINNVNFGLVGIQDILDSNSRAGNKPELHQFPEPPTSTNEKTINIALGHLSLAY